MRRRREGREQGKLLRLGAWHPDTLKHLESHAITASIAVIHGDLISMMTDALALLGGGNLGVGLLSPKQRKKHNNRLLVHKTRQPRRARADDGLPGSSERPASEAEKEALNYFRGNTASLGFFAAAYFYPVFTVPAVALSIYACTPIYRKTYISVVKEKKLKNDLLNGLVVTGTLVTGHFLVTALYTFISNLGSVLVEKSKGYSEEMLTGVFNRKITTVWALHQNAEIETPIEQVKIDDTIIIHTGELIPLDGKIVKGGITVDQHMLTGESIPVEKTVDDEVYASTVVIAGYAWVKVTETGQNTVVAKIENVLQGTSHFKTSLQLKGEQWADSAASPILGLGILMWPFRGLGVATAVFNCSPGNGIRLSASAQTLAHIILASQESILIKDGRVLEQLMEVDTIVFDKTGTLTEDRHEVTRVFSADRRYTPAEVLFYAAATEQRVSHPLAKAILAKAEDDGIELPEFDRSDAKYEVGSGVSATVAGKRVQVGSLSFMKKMELAVPEEIEAQVRQGIADGASMVMVVLDDQIVGAIEIQARLRDEVTNVIAQLRKRGFQHLYILSGDQMEPTRKMAELLELDGYFHNVSPQDKSSVIERLQREGKKVCFIGDGINDVIAMKKANVSISMTGASGIATDVAQVILMSGSLAEIEHLLELAQRLKKKLVMTITSYTTVVVVSFSSIVFLGAPPFVALIVQSLVNNTYGLTQALLPIKQMRDKKRREIAHEKNALLEAGG
jgi:heavy metal translocating P-type ATPase